MFCPAFPPESAISADGGFQIAGASGRVQLEVGTPALTVKSITHAGRDVTDDAFDLTATDSISDVVITLTDKVSSVSGQVRGRDGRPVRNYVVVLLPNNPGAGAGSGRMHVAHAGTDGHFQIRTLRPGRYLAAAVEWIDQGQQFAPEVQQRLRRGARELTIAEGQAATLDLTLTPDN